MRNNKMFYLCDFLDIYGGEEPIFLSISPIIDNEGKYKFECNYYCNEFDIHEVHSNIDSIVNYYKGLQRKYK